MWKVFATIDELTKIITFSLSLPENCPRCIGVVIFEKSPFYPLNLSPNLKKKPELKNKKSRIPQLSIPFKLPLDHFKVVLYGDFAYVIIEYFYNITYSDSKTELYGFLPHEILLYIIVNFVGIIFMKYEQIIAFKI